MRQPSSPLIALAIFSALGAEPGHAGAFNIGEGAGDATISNLGETAYRRFDSSGRLVKAPHFNGYQPKIGFNYGLTNWLMLGFNRTNIYGFNGPSANGRGARAMAIGVNETALQAQIWKNQTFALAAQGTWREQNFDRSVVLLPNGRAANDFDARGLAGANFRLFGLAANVDGQFAYRLRSNGPNEWRGDFSFSVKPDDKWRFTLQSLNVIADAGAAQTRRAFTQYRLQLGAGYALSREWSTQLAVFDNLAGVDARGALGASLSLTRKF